MPHAPSIVTPLWGHRGTKMWALFVFENSNFLWSHLWNVLQTPHPHPPLALTLSLVSSRSSNNYGRLFLCIYRHQNGRIHSQCIHHKWSSLNYILLMSIRAYWSKRRVVPPVLFITNYYSIEIPHGVTAISLTDNNGFTTNVPVFFEFYSENNGLTADNQFNKKSHGIITSYKCLEVLIPLRTNKLSQTVIMCSVAVKIDITVSR